jgi:hypothetical protein
LKHYEIRKNKLEREGVIEDEGDDSRKWARPDNDRKGFEGVTPVRKPENRHNGRRLGIAA